jgi:hypothetical protein
MPNLGAKLSGLNLIHSMVSVQLLLAVPATKPVLAAVHTGARTFDKGLTTVR